MSNVIQSNTKSILSTILTLAIFPMVTFADTYVREDVQTYDAASMKTVAVATGSGEINVSVWDKPVIEVKTLMSIRAKSEEKANEVFDATELEYIQEGDELSLTVKSNSQGSFFNWFKASPKVNVTVMCPKDMNLHASSGSGDVQVSGVSGTHKFGTGSGDIIVENLSGTIKASTGSGDVTAKNVQGSIKAGTGSGDIRIDELEGTVDASTGSGTVDASGAISSFKAGTGSGDVRISSNVAIAEKSKASTGSGDVHVALPANSAFNADLETDSGSVVCDLPIEITRSDKKELAGIVNGGGPEVVLRAGSGDLSVSAH